jgi:hypothetical protein
MQTRACPSCHEIIPSDVDYCPFCGNSTREQLESEDDLIAARNAEARALDAEPVIAPGTYSDEPREPPRERAYTCLMCHARPPVDGEYCVECRQKLDLGPEQWDLMKQQNFQRNLTIGLISLLVVLALGATLAIDAFHRREGQVYSPGTGISHYRPPQPGDGSGAGAPGKNGAPQPGGPAQPGNGQPPTGPPTGGGTLGGPGDGGPPPGSQPPPDQQMQPGSNPPPGRMPPGS